MRKFPTNKFPIQIVISLATLLFTITNVSFADEILLEAEDFSGPWNTQTNIKGYSGRGFRVSNVTGKPADTILEKVITVATSSSYVVWGRGYEGTGYDRRWQIEIDGKLLAVTHASRTANRYSWQRAGQVKLKAGTVTVKIHDAGNLYEVVDAVLLTTNPNYDPDAECRKWMVLNEARGGSIMLNYIMNLARSLPVNKKFYRTKDEWLKSRKEIYAQLLHSLGLDPMPPKTPLNSTIVGKIEREDYFIEKLIFESRPKFYVSAHVYVPKQLNAPAPAVLCPVGHWQHSKMQPQVQSRCIALAKNGYIAMTYDAIGQGERRTSGNNHNIGFSSILVGDCNEGMMVWDSIRAVDYLMTRSDVDPNRIGCTGASGGGLNTMYFAAVDERVRCAVPVCYVTTFSAFMATGMGHCICSHVPGILQFADMSEVCALIAPRPLLIINGVKDGMFPVAGMREVYERTKHIYELFGATEAISKCEVDSRHDYNQAMREAMYGWMDEHLKGIGNGSPLSEPKLSTEHYDSSELHCFPSGKYPKDGETMSSLAAAKAEKLVAKLSLPKTANAFPKWRKAMLARLSVPECLNLLKATDHLSSLKTAPSVKIVGKFEHGKGCTVEKVKIGIAPQRSAEDAKNVPFSEATAIPGLLFIPEDKPAPHPALILVDEAGKYNYQQSKLVKTLIDEGVSVFAIDCHGWGETQFNGHVTATDSILIGKPILGIRFEDIRQAMDYLAIRQDIDVKRIGCLGVGRTGGFLAILAAAFDDRISIAVSDGGLTSYLNLLKRHSTPPPGTCVPRILKATDIPHIVAAIAPRPVLLITKRAELDINQTTVIENAYSLFEKRQNLQIKPDASSDDIARAIVENLMPQTKTK